MTILALVENEVLVVGYVITGDERPPVHLVGYQIPAGPVPVAFMAVHALLI
jgi:hypothetical protein